MKCLHTLTETKFSKFNWFHIKLIIGKVECAFPLKLVFELAKLLLSTR